MLIKFPQLFHTQIPNRNSMIYTYFYRKRTLASPMDCRLIKTHSPTLFQTSQVPHIHSRPMLEIHVSTCVAYIYNKVCIFAITFKSTVKVTYSIQRNLQFRNSIAFFAQYNNPKYVNLPLSIMFDTVSVDHGKSEISLFLRAFFVKASYERQF